MDLFFLYKNVRKRMEILKIVGKFFSPWDELLMKTGSYGTKTCLRDAENPAQGKPLNVHAIERKEAKLKPLFFLRSLIIPLKHVLYSCPPSPYCFRVTYLDTTSSFFLSR